jgi:hypothetical protein
MAAPSGRVLGTIRNGADFVAAGSRHLIATHAVPEESVRNLLDRRALHQFTCRGRGSNAGTAIAGAMKDRRRSLGRLH